MIIIRQGSAGPYWREGTVAHGELVDSLFSPKINLHRILYSPTIYFPMVVRVVLS